MFHAPIEHIHITLKGNVFPPGMEDIAWGTVANTDTVAFAIIHKDAELVIELRGYAKWPEPFEVYALKPLDKLTVGLGIQLFRV